MMTINIFSEGVDLPFKELSEESIRIPLETAAKKVNIRKGALSVILTDDKGIQAINRDYRKKDISTDVISFVYSDTSFPGEELSNQIGDIYISLDTAERQAEEYGTTYREEMNRLLIHGLLHCAGFDHEGSQEEALKMENLEEEILKSMK